MRVRGLARVVGFAALLGFAACGDDGDDARGADVGVDAVAATFGDGVMVSGAEAAEVGARLAGRYAHYDVVAYEATDMKTLIVSYGFTDLAWTDDRLVSQESFCSAEHVSDQPIETSISDAATQAIKPPPATVEISRQADGRYALWRPETPTPVGIRLDDPANESLPDDPNDPRIVDDDNDGNPGITVRVQVSEEFGGDIYIARREIFSYGVTEASDDRLEGTVTDRSEQLIIGASDPVFAMAADWSQHPDLSKSPILLERVTADWDCARLMAERPALFPATPAVDW